MRQLVTPFVCVTLEENPTCMPLLSTVPAHPWRGYLTLSAMPRPIWMVLWLPVSLASLEWVLQESSLVLHLQFQDIRYLILTGISISPCPHLSLREGDFKLHFCPYCGGLHSPLKCPLLSDHGAAILFSYQCPPFRLSAFLRVSCGSTLQMRRTVQKPFQGIINSK